MNLWALPDWEDLEEYGANSRCLSADGKRLAVWKQIIHREDRYDDDTEWSIHVFDVAAQARVATLDVYESSSIYPTSTHEGGALHAVAFSADGSELIVQQLDCPEHREKLPPLSTAVATPEDALRRLEKRLRGALTETQYPDAGEAARIIKRLGRLDARRLAPFIEEAARRVRSAKAVGQGVFWVSVLGGLGEASHDPAAMRVLREKARDRRVAVRERVAIELGGLPRDADVEQTLLDLLADRSAGVARCAHASLFKRGAPMKPERLAELILALPPADPRRDGWKRALERCKE